MSTILWALLAVGLVVYGYFRDRHLVQAAIAEGQRAALKEAIDYCRSRQDVAVYMAPEGEMTMALCRARAIHDVEMELRGMLVRL